MAPPHSGQMQFKIADLISFGKLRLSNIRLLYIARELVLFGSGHRTRSNVDGLSISTPEATRTVRNRAN